MQQVVMQGLILVAALCCGAAMDGGAVAIPLVVGFLATVCILSVVRFAGWRQAALLNAACCMLLVCLPHCVVFLPACAADAGARLPDAPTRPWCWTAIIPTAAALGAAVLHANGIDRGFGAGGMAIFIALAIVLATVLGTLVGAVIAASDREMRRMRALADAQRERLRLSRARIGDLETSRSADLQRARLRERSRIAREIHDNVGHLLTGAIMLVQADQVVAQTTGDALHAEQFRQVGVQLDEAMTMIRRSVHDLKDQGTDFAAMLEDATAVASSAGLDVKVTAQLASPPSVIAHCFAAVVREALTNTVRHGSARHAHVSVNDLPGLWQCIVQDDGSRTDRLARTVSPGIGLADIEERARALGGTASCGWHGPGWRVFVSIPKPKEDQA